MKITITGATGFLGQELTLQLIKEGHNVVALTRNKENAKKILPLPNNDIYQWEDYKQLPPKEAIKDTSVIINLMGENISNKKWSKGQKQKIYDSRVIATENLIKAINDYRENNLILYANASAIGFYSSNINQIHDEESPNGKGFLANVTKDWESQVEKLQKADRKLIVRIGVICGEQGGMLKKLLPIFRMGLAGPIGNGKQIISWIHLKDLANIFVKAISNSQYQGVINATAPNVCTNNQLTKAISKALGIYNIIPVPKFALKLSMGEMSSIAIDSINAIPKKLMALNHKFLYETIDKAMEDICNVGIFYGNKKKPHYLFKSAQYINKNIDDVFYFFSNINNLEKITPSYLKFKIIGENIEPPKKGLKINYKLNIRGIPVNWQSLILEWDEKKSFTDIQTKGPYSIWHHKHIFIPYKEGTIVLDEVHYRIPLGLLGNAITPLITNDIKNIFSYRRKTIPNLL